MKKVWTMNPKYAEAKEFNDFDEAVEFAKELVEKNEYEVVDIIEHEMVDGNYGSHKYVKKIEGDEVIKAFLKKAFEKALDRVKIDVEKEEALNESAWLQDGWDWYNESDTFELTTDWYYSNLLGWNNEVQHLYELEICDSEGVILELQFEKLKEVYEFMQSWSLDRNDIEFKLTNVITEEVCFEWMNLEDTHEKLNFLVDDVCKLKEVIIGDLSWQKIDMFANLIANDYKLTGYGWAHVPYEACEKNTRLNFFIIDPVEKTFTCEKRTHENKNQANTTLKEFERNFFRLQDLETLEKEGIIELSYYPGSDSILSIRSKSNKEHTIEKDGQSEEFEGFANNVFEESVDSIIKKVIDIPVEDGIISPFLGKIGTSRIENQQLYNTTKEIIEALERETQKQITVDLKNSMVENFKYVWRKYEQLSYIDIEYHTLRNIDRGILRIQAEEGGDDLFEELNEELYEFFETKEEIEFVESKENGSDLELQ